MSNIFDLQLLTKLHEFVTSRDDSHTRYGPKTWNILNNKNFLELSMGNQKEQESDFNSGHVDELEGKKLVFLLYLKNTKKQLMKLKAGSQVFQERGGFQKNAQNQNQTSKVSRYHVT